LITALTQWLTTFGNLNVSYKSWLGIGGLTKPFGDYWKKKLGVNIYIKEDTGPPCGGKFNIML